LRDADRAASWLKKRAVAPSLGTSGAATGPAPLPDLMFEDPMFKDVLKPVLTDYPMQEPTLYVVYVSRKHLPLKIRVPSAALKLRFRSDMVLQPLAFVASNTLPL
jgi:hypothetical protein